MKGTPLRLVAAAGLVTALLATAGCSGSGRSLEPWSTSGGETASQQVLPPRLPTEASPSTYFISDDPRAGLPVPSAWRIQVVGTVSDGSQAIPIDLDGWLLVTYPYDDIGGTLNDVNLVDIGIRTDLSPLEGYSGALWFGTNTSIMSDLQIPVTLSGADVDIVTERREDDVVYADLNAGLAPLDVFNIYNVETGQTAQLNNVLTGTVSVRFSADGSSITGRIDLGGTSGTGTPTVSSEHHAEITGQRYTG